MWTPAERREKANGQAGEGGGEDHMAVTSWPACETMMKQRRFKLAVALEVADRGDEDFTADNTAGGGVGLTTAGGEAGGVAEGGEGGVAKAS